MSGTQNGSRSATTGTNKTALSIQLESFSLLSALAYDPRPTLVLDFVPLEPNALPLILFSNPALEALPNLHTALRTNPIPLVSSTEPTGHVILHALKWDQYTIEGRWRVLSAPASSSDILAQWTRSESLKNPKDLRLSKEENARPRSLILKRKSSSGELDESNKHRALLPAPTIHISVEHDHFMDLFDWNAMKMGPSSGWPRELLELFLLISVDPRPAGVYWGTDDWLFFYNKAYIPLLGDKSICAMGVPIRETYPDLWESVDEMIFRQIKRKKSFTNRAQPFSYLRDSSFLEERFFDYTCIPIINTNMEVVGMFSSSIDVTRNFLEQKRCETLAAISAIATQSQYDNMWLHILETFSDSKDLPQSLLYSIGSEDGDESQTCKLEGSLSVNLSDYLESFPPGADHNIARLFRHSMTLDRPLYLSRRKAYGQSDLWLQNTPGYFAQDLCDLLPNLFHDFEPSSGGDPCDSVAVMPIYLTKSHRPRGFAIFGLNARHSYDEGYESFMVQLQKTISETVTSAILWREGSLSNARVSAQLVRQTEEKIAVESRFSQLAHHAPIGICIYNADGSKAFANEKWYSLCEFPSDADSTSPGWWASIVYPDDLPTAFSSFAQLQLEHKRVYFEIRLAVASKHYPSSFTWVLVSAYPEMKDNQELESIVAFFTDITEQKITAEIERKRTKEAVEAKHQQENFIDVTSHEIRNPLTVSLQCSEEISSIATKGMQGATSDDTNVTIPIHELHDILKAAEVIEQCTMHQRRIVDDILTLSKMEGGMLPFNISPAQPLVVVKDTLKIFSREFVHSGIEITLQTGPSFDQLVGEQSWLELDSGRISQMLINLITNAIKFTKTQAKRTIQLRIGASKVLNPLELSDLQYLPLLDHETTRIGTNWKDDESVYIHFLVSDSGSGISEEDQTTLFIRFSQGFSKDYTQYGGSGLGLYICRALVEMHGGQIGFKSTFGVGSTFGFCIKTRFLPDTAIPPPTKSSNRSFPKPLDAASREGDGSTPASGSSTFNIMIVEDNLIIQQVLSKQLKKAGHTVDIVNHGKECLEILAESHFCKVGGNKLSLLLMDVEMPVMNGIDCTKEIGNMEKEGRIRGHVPIIATTGNARDEKVGLIEDAGVDRVVLKPYSVPDLLQLVEELITNTKSYD